MSQLSKHPAQPADIREKLELTASSLAMLPAVAQEALRIASDADSCTDHFASVVERDINLATKILNVANSAIFRRGEPLSSIRHATIRLGFRECRNIILTVGAASLMKNIPLEQEWVQEALWRHSLTTATACAHLNRELELGFEGEEFTAGLIHDLGRLLIANADFELFSQTDPLDFVEHQDPTAAETEVLGIDHAEAGACFTEKSHLPEDLVAAIRYHHQPPIEHSASRLIALTAAGDHVANHIQRFDEASGYDPSTNHGVARLCEIDSPELGPLFEAISPRLIQEVIDDVQSPLSSLGFGG